MNAKQEAQKSKLDGIKWAVVVVLFAAGLWANYHYMQIDWALRAAGWIVLLCIMVSISLQTATGKRVWVFAKDARGELRKVVWPTRQETLQTTLIIVVMVMCMALILWGIDSILLWIIGWLTGQRG
jgi:preprotein translocase subunit SecE